MIKANLEKKYLVNKKGKDILVEVYRSVDGKTFVVIENMLKHTFEKKGEELEWENIIKDAEEVDYDQLPREVRKAISAATKA